MKILYHHRTQSKDGQAVHIEELIQALREEGCEVIVVEPHAHREAKFGGTSRGIEALKRVLPKAVYEALELVYSVVAYRKLLAAVRRHRPDALYDTLTKAIAAIDVIENDACFLVDTFETRSIAPEPVVLSGLLPK